MMKTGNSMLRLLFAVLMGSMVCSPGVSANDAEPVFADGIERISQVRKSIRNVDIDGLQALAKQYRDLHLIDVRTAEEVATLGGMIDLGYRTHLINRGWLEFRIGETIPDRSTPIVVYCGINQRSPLGADTLQKMGYTNVYNFADGFFKWRDAGHPVTLADEAVGTILYRKPVEVADGVWSAIGATAPPTYENSGHNNNLSFIVTEEGVVVVNAGDNYLLAQALHAEIKLITDKPVKYVVLENGQGHAMLGSGYWQEQGALVIAHEDAAAQIEEHGTEILERMQRRNRDKAMGTKLAVPDRTFADSFDLSMGGRRIEALNLGPAHSPGDIVVWLDDIKLVISGDMAFHQRLLPVFEYTDTAGWVETWGDFEALGANIVIPGHGVATDMAEVRRYTHDYLVHLRKVVGDVLENGGTLQDAYSVDQSAYAHLDTFDELAVLNADRVFRAMEFE